LHEPRETVLPQGTVLHFSMQERKERGICEGGTEGNLSPEAKKSYVGHAREGRQKEIKGKEAKDEGKPFSALPGCLLS